MQAHDQLYDQASPDKRTEADGNSDPNSGKVLLLLILHMVSSFLSVVCQSMAVLFTETCPHYIIQKLLSLARVNVRFPRAPVGFKSLTPAV